ncbi:MAG: DUF4340 domain-containing protein [Pseudomonadota bacterium]
MKGRPLSLVVGAVLAALVAYLVSQNRAPDTRLASEESLVPGLAEGLNEVSRLVITGPGDRVKVSLSRGDDRWTVDERGGYVADTAKIRSLLIDLGDARLLEQKTSREENYAALGVQAIDADDAGGVQVLLEGLDGAPAVIIGKPARNAGSVYVRRADEATSWATNKRLRVEQDPAQWLVKDIVDIRPARIQSVRIEHPDGEVFEATRGEVNFTVANVPEDAELTSPSAANALADVFSKLKFEDVRPASEFAPGDAPSTEATFVTSDGLSLGATVTASEGKYFLSLKAAAVPVDPATLPVDEADGEDATAVPPTPEQKAAAMLEAMAAQSATINARTEGWVFTIPLFKYEQLTRRVGDLVSTTEDSDLGPT